MKDPKHPEALPQVNNNGTTRKDLMAQKLAVRRVLRSAIDLLSDATPHGRDYQTLPNGGGVQYRAARELHRDRMDTLTDLWTELGCEAYAIQNQGK